jgi:hypothetical protein
VDRYDWLSGRSAPPFCPMEIESSYFFYKGGGIIYVPPGQFEEHNWSSSSALDIVGPDLKRLPERLKVTYYSYWEDKIYQGDFVLPYDRIAKLFADGFQTLSGPQKAHVTYQRIVAGVAPGGAVTVWLEGGGRRTQVLFAYANAVEANWHETFEYAPEIVRQEWRSSVLAALPDNAITRQYKKAVPFGLWERWQKRYAWYPVFENLAVPNYLFPVHYFNGERIDIRFPQTEPPSDGRATPSTLGYKYIETVRGAPKSCFLEAIFDQDETLQAFDRLSQDGKPFQLVIRRDGPGEYPTEVLVRNDSLSIQLSKVSILRRGAL